MALVSVIFQGLIYMHKCDMNEPTEREGFWAYKLSFMPQGLNSNKGRSGTSSINLSTLLAFNHINDSLELQTKEKFIQYFRLFPSNVFPTSTFRQI